MTAFYWVLYVNETKFQSFARRYIVFTSEGTKFNDD